MYYAYGKHVNDGYLIGSTLLKLPIPYIKSPPIFPTIQYFNMQYMYIRITINAI